MALRLRHAADAGLRVLSALIAAGALLGAEARAKPGEIAATLPQATQVGAARYVFLNVAVFDATLWANDGAFAWERPFALSLTYRRAFTARALTNRTLQGMRDRGAGETQSLAPLAPRLRACFTDVARGDRITAVSVAANRAHIYHNGAFRCALEWPGLRRSFFGIWLEAHGEARTFSRRLRGEP